MSKVYYGLTNKRQAYEIAGAVVNCVGGGDNATALLIETAQQETKLGSYPDKSAYGAGVGLCQCDPIAFFDTKDRTKDSVKERIKDAFGIDVNTVSHAELAYSPLLAFIWCRLHYLLRPGAIPVDVGGRAAYWKKWYNSELGRGTENEYIASAQEINGGYA